MRDRICVLALATALGITHAAVYQVAPGPVNAAATPLRTGRLTGTVLPIWTPPAIFANMKRGLDEQGFRLFRFPNGSLSNDYHWNGAGAYDSAWIWHPSADSVAPGFLSDTRYRGTTKKNFSSIFPSNLTDGADSTIWWSDPAAGGDAWAAIDLGASLAIDSVRIVWGALRPDSVAVGNVATTGYNPFISPDAAFIRHAAEAVGGGATTLRLGGAMVQYLAVRPLGIGASGVQIGEIRAWSKGVAATANVADQAKQSQAWAFSTHPGNIRSKDFGGYGSPAWNFQTFIDYLAGISGAEALICVNYGTGTAEEAAAWVRYANVRKHLGIRLWQVGNEIDGYWEEGGPVSAAQYARKYLAYAKAMKAVDPDILILGPVFSTMEFATTGSSELNGTTWMEEFLRAVGEAEAADGKRYLDGIDFHAYPYWANGAPSPVAMLAQMRRLEANLDTLSAMMHRHLQDPGSRLVSLSEFNATVQTMDLTMRPENATGMSLMLAQLAGRFGGQAMSIAWEAYGASSGNPDGSTGATYGTLALFLPPGTNAASSIELAPNAPYWGNWMISKAWAIDSARPMAAIVTGGNLLEAHALTDGKDTSYIFHNLSASACSLRVAPPLARGYIYEFSARQYAWNGTTSAAFAAPNSGPSSRPVPAAWDGGLAIPAFGMAVVRSNAATASAAGDAPTVDHVVQMAVNGKLLESGDTLLISGTLLRAPDAPAPKAHLGNMPIELTASDGAWDGPEEAFLAKVAPSQEQSGWLRLGASDSIPIQITGKARPSLLVDRFEDELLPSDQPSRNRWDTYAAGGPPTSVTLTFPPRATGGRALLATSVLKQPVNLGYTVYTEVLLGLDQSLVANSVGVKFDYASWHSHPGTFTLLIPTDTVKNYDEYILDLPATDSAWRSIRLKWSDFKQQGWGGVLTGPLLARQIHGLLFRANGEGDARFQIDNLFLLGTEGDSLSAVRPATAPRAAWSILPREGQWLFRLPAGATVRLYGLDGRQEWKWQARQAASAAYRPRHAGIVYAEVEYQGRREVKMLPNLR
jgi:hypothetical protein